MRLDELNGALDRLEASSEHESRPALMGKLVAKSTEILGPEEGRQHLDVTGGERVLVQLGSKPAEGDDRVQLVDHRLQQASGAPKLRRSSVRERATPAGRLRADLAAKPEERVRRAEEPVLHCRVQA